MNASFKSIPNLISILNVWNLHALANLQKKNPKKKNRINRSRIEICIFQNCLKTFQSRLIIIFLIFKFSLRKYLYTYLLWQQDFPHSFCKEKIDMKSKQIGTNYTLRIDVTFDNGWHTLKQMMLKCWTTHTNIPITLVTHSHGNTW